MNWLSKRRQKHKKSSGYTHVPLIRPIPPRPKHIPGQLPGSEGLIMRLPTTTDGTPNPFLKRLDPDKEIKSASKKGGTV